MYSYHNPRAKLILIILYDLGAILGVWYLLAVMHAQKGEDKCWIKSTPDVWLWKQRDQGIFSLDKFVGVFPGLQQVNALRGVCGGDGVKRVVCRYGWECFGCFNWRWFTGVLDELDCESTLFLDYDDCDLDCETHEPTFSQCVLKRKFWLLYGHGVS